MEFGPFKFTNNVSGVVLGGLCIVIAGLVWLIREIYKVRATTAEAKEVAKQTVDNTRNISNGFAKGVNSKLDRMIVTIDELQQSHADHLRWHLEQEKNR